MRACELGCLLVAARCCGRKLLLDRLDMTVELHRDITMTSLMKSVKHQLHVCATHASRQPSKTSSGKGYEATRAVDRGS